MLLGLLTAIPGKSLLAAEDWSLCRIPSFEFIESGTLGIDDSDIEAQSMLALDGEQLQFSGKVQLLRKHQSLAADELSLNKTTRQILASGNVIFEDASYRLSSSQIKLDDLQQSGLFSKAEFELADNHARGKADSIEKLDQSRSLYSGLIYTTCDPQQNDWYLRASELEIDDESGRGVAKHTTLYFKDIPFFYLPYFQFPIDDRRMSGLLAPRIGYDQTLGGQLALPVYWNIAANHDATITPIWYGKRGLQLNTENRYLFKRDSGQLDLSYLDDDAQADSRWWQQWQHSANYAADIELNLLLTEVSDGQFFDDFESVAPEYIATDHLQRYVSLARFGDEWQSELMWQNYQTLDSNSAIEDRPYRRLPRISLNGQPDWFSGNLAFRLSGEWVQFEREQSVTGARSHIQPSLSWRASDRGYFFEPALQLAYSDYQLEDNPNDNSLYRSLATLSIDSGLIFERSAGAQKQWTQSFEPRLFFLFTPYQNQDDIPAFDTALLFKTYDNLFRRNRFSGIDRIGDANQVTLGLANRLIANESGAQLLQARLGQTYYFEDRRVSLDNSVETQTLSDSVAEIDLWPNENLKLSARVAYSPEQHKSSNRGISVNYSAAGVAANLEYYFIDSELEQALLSMVYPVNERWTLVAKTQHSLLFDRPVENLIGLAYESCCWGLKILARQSADEQDNFAQTENSIFLELSLKGLSQAGDDIDARLSNAIPGYKPDF